MDLYFVIAYLLAMTPLAVANVVVWFWPEIRAFFTPARNRNPPEWPVVTPERERELHTMPYEDYLRTPEWTQRALSMKTRAGWKCEACGSPHFLQAHHLTYRRRGYERPSDLQVLCRDCHKRVHGTQSPNA